MSDAKEVTDATFATEVLKASKPVLVDFSATWCGPCRTIAPIIEGIATDFGDRIDVAMIDIERSPYAAHNNGVRSVPTLMIFRNGQAVAKRVGAAPKTTLRKWVTSNFDKPEG